MCKSLLTHELAVDEINNVVPNILVQKKKEWTQISIDYRVS